MKSATTKYMTAHKNGKLKEAVSYFKQSMDKCEICPRKCGANRNHGELGLCETGKFAVVSSYCPHFGEEEPLVGRFGSGAIFFSHCNLMCNFCQNYEVSHFNKGIKVNDFALANIMLTLQNYGCHNINFVSPTHVLPQILSALEYAVSMGLNIPIVYNTSSYDSVETLKHIEGIFDIYLPDIKFWDPETAELTCKAKNYPEIARNAVREMYNQVGDLEIDDNKIARSGLLVRHLLMPDCLGETEKVMTFLANDVSVNTYVNVMAQFVPVGNSAQFPKINRRVSSEEYELGILVARDAGLWRINY